MADPEVSLPLLVVLDTNQWRAQYGLRSRLGAALLHFVSQHEGHIGLPEVVEVELSKHLVVEGVKAVDLVDAQLRIIQKLTGSMPSVALPNRQELEEAVAARLADLDGLLHRVAIDSGHTRRALLRANAERSPNRNKDQFKDSLIWEACRDLGSEYDVHLVTADAAFFEPTYVGLADDLREECEADGLSIRVHRDVAHVLDFLRDSAPQIDYDGLAQSLLSSVAPQVNAMIAEKGFEIGGLSHSEVQAFATEQLDLLALTFELQALLDDRKLSEGGTDRKGRVIVLGEATFDSKSQQMNSVSVGRVEARHLDEVGNEVGATNVVIGAAHMYLGGEPPKPLEIRAAIERTGQGSPSA